MSKLWFELNKVVSRTSWRVVLIVCVFVLFCLCFFEVKISQNPYIFVPFWRLIMR